ncbi:hypothetical protein VIGAN_01222200 [Vigna angularis var. angularis]|uniref:Membrane-associated kinase regulator 6 n=1 Tax=Vigna angularis var. angularis TaxID=157739 RepID=A0A0S3R1S1_PHAAN|nr:probable membrane-associated kinase regulator 6 [Vigna angularis]BAT74534.1 hypothetical protein VIGAN_01222200 [Vigna angularis var. angularis]
MLKLLLKVSTIFRSCCSICPLLDLDRIDELSPCGHHCFVTISYTNNVFVAYTFFIHHNLKNRCLQMETSLPLATDSFSYGWLSNCKPFANDLQELLRESSSTCNSPLMEEWQSFNFDISFTHSPAVLAHADELFSNGLIKPLFVGPSKLDSCKTTQDSTLQSQPVSSFSSRIVSPRTLQIHHGFLTRWKTSTCRTLRNLSRYVNQLCQRVASSRKNTKVDDFDKEDWLVNSWSSSHQASPKSSSISPIGALHDHENSIYEAVLHCKRSIER